jgi:hypothetical protein
MSLLFRGLVSVVFLSSSVQKKRTALRGLVYRGRPCARLWSLEVRCAPPLLMVDTGDELPRRFSVSEQQQGVPGHLVMTQICFKTGDRSPLPKEASQKFNKYSSLDVCSIQQHKHCTFGRYVLSFTIDFD